MEGMPVVGTELAAEARQAIVGFDRAPRWTPAADVEEWIAELSVIYPASKVSQAEADARMTLYARLLYDVPPDILKRAILRTAQTCKFFPSVAEIRAEAAGPMAQREWRRSALRWMVLMHERHWTPPLAPEDYVKPEEIAEIKRAAGIPEPDENREGRRARNKERRHGDAQKKTSTRADW